MASVISIIKNFGVLINVMISINAFLLIGFNEATLANHLKVKIKLMN